jgi:hypothetical protein
MVTQAWFASELAAINLTGLEGVYDYVQTMPENEAAPYLESLLGSSPAVLSFVSSYLSRRRAAPSSSSSSASASRSPGDEHPTGNGRQPRVRSRGRDRAKTTSVARNDLKNETFASVSGPGSSGPPPRRDAAVERARDKLRACRANRTVVNCLACGFVERNVPEDGACAFCGMALFPIELERGDGTAHGMDDSVSRQAELHRDKLLALDRNAVQRSAVVDDDAAYVDADSNSWLSVEERKAACEKRDAAAAERARKSITVTIDLAGRKILDGRSASSAIAVDRGDQHNSEEQEYPQANKEQDSLATSSLVERSSENASSRPGGGTGAFANPLLPGPGPRFTFSQKIGGDWFESAAAVDVDPSPVTGRVQRDEPVL